MTPATKPRVRVKAYSTPHLGLISPTPRNREIVAFEAGKSHRRLRAVPTAGNSINAQIRRYGRSVLARSRWLCANNTYASGAKDIFKSALVGCGIKPSPLLSSAALKKELNLLWYDWCDEADADNATDLYGLENFAAGEIFEGGECFIRLRDRRAEDLMLVPLQLQLLPAEMLDLAFNQDLGSGRRIECGIQFDAIGKREGYHFWRYHPYSDAGNRYERVFVSADQVIHMFLPRVVGQVRGVPHTISGIAKLAMLDAYDDAELERKRTAALFGGFITRKGSESDEDHPLETASELPPTADETDPFSGQDNNAFNDTQSGLGIGLEPGAFLDLDEGESVEFSEPADVGGSYEAFQYRTLLAVASGFGVPYADMTGDLRQANYGSIRAGLVQFRRKMEAMQHQIMVFQFCRRVREKWLEAAVLAGATSITPSQFYLNKRDYLRTKWIPPKWEWVDPLKDLNAEKVAVDNGFKARSDVQEESGFDPEETDARILSDQEREEEMGIVIPARKAATPPAPPLPPDPNPDDNPDDGEDVPLEPPPDPEETQPTPPRRRSGQRGRASPYALNLTVNLPKDGKKIERTKVTAFDDRGRIKEFERETVEEEA